MDEKYDRFNAIWGEPADKTHWLELDMETVIESDTPSALVEEIQDLIKWEIGETHNTAISGIQQDLRGEWP